MAPQAQQKRVQAEGNDQGKEMELQGVAEKQEKAADQTGSGRDPPGSNPIPPLFSSHRDSPDRHAHQLLLQE